jgi:hypothetical protein
MHKRTQRLYIHSLLPEVSCTQAPEDNPSLGMWTTIYHTTQWVSEISEPYDPTAEVRIYHSHNLLSYITRRGTSRPSKWFCYLLTQLNSCRSLVTPLGYAGLPFVQWPCTRGWVIRKELHWAWSAEVLKSQRFEIRSLSLTALSFASWVPGVASY